MSPNSFAAEPIIHYERHEFHYPDPEPRTAALSVFVYDIPYFGACGIFPPFQIASQVFSSGGSQGGMSPGATWQPFSISQEEYNDLVERVRRTDPTSLKGKARYTMLKFGFDSQFDGIQDRFSWLTAVCEKHRDEYHRANRELSRHLDGRSR